MCIVAPAPPLAEALFRMKKKIYNDITEAIGDTPLVRLNRTAAADILLKLAFFNPLADVSLESDPIEDLYAAQPA